MNSPVSQSAQKENAVLAAMQRAEVQAEKAARFAAIGKKKTASILAAEIELAKHFAGLGARAALNA